ncbi:MAG: sigma 54-interacting transcriptional regulator [bacterium]|nr:sigma 54-interacting transcriptional regulator [bacterium]
MQQIVPAYLIIQLGSRWTDILRLQPDNSVVVGRSSECQIVIKDERVSRKHAEFTPHNGGWQVVDLGSRNGTLVEGQAIKGPRKLADGDHIEVGGCRLKFAIGLRNAFPATREGALKVSVASEQQTQEFAPTIINRRSESQWSSPSLEWDDGSGMTGGTGRASVSAEPWNFFYRLIANLVAAPSPEAAAQAALDSLLQRLGLTFGGVVTLQAGSDNSISNMAVLATKQAAGSSYHRVSDFLVQAVVRDKQAVLARNVRDDSKLSLARASGQREIVSILCAPLRTQEDNQTRVHGLLHVYTAGDERMLSDSDLELAVGVADNLAIALSRQAENQKLTKSLESVRRHAQQLQQQLDESTVMVGSSKELQGVRDAIRKAGPTTATILIRGESGVGKELVARAIHRSSERKDGPLVCLNCAALAPSLLESELFGHEKGAFTGATDRKAGKFEVANGGTLLLDEVGELPAELQAKFLRVLEEQTFERVGGHKSIHTDVRVIAATNRDLEEAVRSKDFRSDLYYRLRVIEIYVPPLRERKEDIPLLVEHFIEQLRHHAARQLTGVAPAALEMLTRHDWPGNVRELRNVIERAIVLGAKPTIEPDDLSLVSFADTMAPASASDSRSFQPISLAELEKLHILAMLDYTEGNKSKAAQLLGIERSTLDRKLKRY